VGTFRVEHRSEATAIIEAVRRIHDDARILEEARRSLGRALDLLGLEGTARQAVTPLLAAATSHGPNASVSVPTNFWLN
jgi:hypothetical protein